MNKSLLSIICFITVITLSNSIVAKDNKENSVLLNQPATCARCISERKDDFDWAPDLLAFRAYGPALREGAENAGVDCWLKRVEKPIIDLWYARHQQGISYHKDNGEGLDNYHVGSSAGCGSTSLWLNSKRTPLETYTSWKIIEQSIEKTVFVLSYEKKIDGKTYKEDKQISIELGRRLFHVKSTFWVDDKIATGLPVTVGLATHDEKATVTINQKNGWLSTWEVIDHYGLGVAVKIAPQRIEDIRVIQSNDVKDNGHAVFIMNTDSQGEIEYHAGYGWEKAGFITSNDKWSQYLNTYFTAVQNNPKIVERE